MNRAKIIAKITEKWPVKVLSLAAAIIISVFYRMNTLETRIFTVPLVIEYSDTLIIVNSFSSSVRVSLRGEADSIQPILEEDIEAYIDLGRYSAEGSFRVPVQIRKKGTAIGIEPLEISVSPIEIPLLLEQRVTKNIFVFPVFSGIVAEGYELTYQSLIPGSVIAEGPRSLLESNLEFYTETINLDRRYDNFSIMVSIIEDNPMISIHGSRILEFRASISRIAREEPVVEIIPIQPRNEYEEDEEEEELHPDGENE